ncbi:MAG: helix-turn-helix domain-containing protein [Thermomicrobiales bacterium]
MLVRDARLKMGWTQDELAKRIGIDKGYISAIEVGTRRWPLEHIEALATTLGLDYLEMVVAAGMVPESAGRRRAVDDTFPEGDPARDILARMREMSIADREAMRDYADFLASRRAPKP